MVLFEVHNMTPNFLITQILSLQVPPVQMDERAAHTDSIYENVFYSK